MQLYAPLSLSLSLSLSHTHTEKHAQKHTQATEERGSDKYVLASLQSCLNIRMNQSVNQHQTGMVAEVRSTC